MSKIIGIDLGSTASEVAVMEGGQPSIIINDEGNRITPSVISFSDSGERRVGSAAKRQALTNPKGTVVLIKRFMGSTYEEAKPNFSHVQYDIVDSNGYPRVKIGDREYSPEELSSMILQKMKKTAEDYLGEEVTDAVITVPAYFNDAQREATKKAGEIAGLNVKRIIAEPTAAILASKIDMEKGGKFMVVDYGGSTLDFSIADIADNVVEIKASNGDVYCGGSDLDRMIVDYLVASFKENEGIDLSTDPMASQRLVEAAENAKKELSTQTSVEINLPYIIAVDGTPKHLNETLTRAKFEQIIDKEIAKVIKLGKEALKKANMTKDELDGVLLVGGSTRIPLVQSELIKAFGDKLINNFNPDEVVALGAAVQGSIIAGEKTDVLLLDVTPLSLGIDTMGGVMAKIVDANTTIPCKKSQIFTTATDNQPAVTITVVQGNRTMTKDNKQIGVFNLDGIAPAMRGVPQIEVTFDIDANGLLSVSAVDKGTGKEQHITIESKSSLSDEDIENMRKDAEAHAEEDKKTKEKMDTINMADSFGFGVEKAMSEMGDKITDEQKTSINGLISTLRDAVKEQDLDKVNEAKKALENAWNPIMEEIYKSSASNGGEQGGGTSTSGNPFAGFDFNPSNNPFAK
jgi:molecular chaperone DnaK